MSMTCRGAANVRMNRKKDREVNPEETKIDWKESIAATNRYGEQKWGALWTKNVHANLKTIWNSPGTQALIGRPEFRRKPAVVIGAGPSLDKNARLVHKYRDLYYTIVVDKALPAFSRPDMFDFLEMEPDFCMFVDAQEQVKHYIDPSRNHATAAIMSTIVHPSVVQAWKGPRFFFAPIPCEEDTTIRKLNKETGQLGHIMVKCTVASGALFAALAMGFSPVILVGMDFAFTDDKWYSRFVLPKDAPNQAPRDGRVEVEDIYGKPTITSEDMMLFSHGMGEIIKPAYHQVVNATEGGILKAYHMMSFEAAVERFGQPITGKANVIRKYHRMGINQHKKSKRKRR